MIRIETPDAPAAIGPYSQAVTLDGWIFASGQIPLEPASGEVTGGGIEAQTRRVLENLSAVLVAAGGSLETVVKTTVYLSSMEHFPAVNRVYGEYFGSHRPARATVAVRGLPKAVDVEIEAVARIGPLTGEPGGREQSRPPR